MSKNNTNNTQNTNNNATQNNTKETKKMNNNAKNNTLSNTKIKEASNTARKYQKLANKKIGANNLPVNVTKKAHDLFNNSEAGKLWKAYNEKADAYEKAPKGTQKAKYKKERDVLSSACDSAITAFQFSELAETLIERIAEDDGSATDKEKVENVNELLNELGLKAESAVALGKMTAIIYSMVTRVDDTISACRNGGTFSTKRGTTFHKQIVKMLMTLTDKEKYQARQKAKKEEQKAKEAEKAKKEAEKEAKRKEREAKKAQKEAEKAKKEAEKKAKEEAKKNNNKNTTNKAQ